MDLDAYRAKAAQMETTVREYMEACNRADHAGIKVRQSDDSVHYFPAGTPFPKLIGADAIATGWVEFITKWGMSWEVHAVIADPINNTAVSEWTCFQKTPEGYTRGSEWYRFDDQGRISEVRAYFACPAQKGSRINELEDFPYAERGYGSTPPV